MGSLGASVFFLVMLVNFQIILSKPLFGDLFCDLFCDDDDITSTSTTTSASTEDDYFGFGDWCSCGPTTRRPNNARGGQGFPSINMVLPPSNGMNLTMVNNNGLWTFDLNAAPNGNARPMPGNNPGLNAAPNGPGNNPGNPGMGPFPTTAAPTTAGSTPAATTAAA